MRPDADLGLLDGAHKEPDARVRFASIQTLARHLDAFDPSHFARTSSSTIP